MIGWLRPGDLLVLLGGLVLLGVLLARMPESGDRLRITRDGRPFMEMGTRIDRVVSVPGPLGETRVEIRGGRVRVQSDPSPRQLCVRQGWLRPGEAALCLPNRVGVEWGRGGYDSLNY